MVDGNGLWMKPDKSECVNKRLAAIMQSHVCITLFSPISIRY